MTDAKVNGSADDEIGLAPKAPKPQVPSQDNIDFSDPDQLAALLGSSTLTDQEEEDLLRQALVINQKLREELHQQEQRGRENTTRNRLGSGRKATLPPIEYNEKLGRKKKIYGASTSKSQEKSTSPPKARSSTGQRKPPSAASPRKKGGSAPPGVVRSKTYVESSRPDWNERFSFE